MVAPTTEIGHGGTSIVPWANFVDNTEQVPELRWPNSVMVYDRMRADAQIAAVLKAGTLPIRRYKWKIDPNGASPEVTEFVAQELNLPVEGEEPKPRPRNRGRFSHEEHLRHALLSMVFGHMFFEQVYRAGDEGNRLHIRKLAPRMPATISEIAVAKDGGLEYIRQFSSGQMNDLQAPRIPVNRLVAYINDREGGNWIGRSVLRECYKHWLIKDRLLRVDAMKHERNGMGVPIIESQQGATPNQIRENSKLAQQYKSGEASGGALPFGTRLRLVGVEGSLPDTIESIRYQDEQIAKSMLEMFIQLGTTQTGSRALGESFTDFFALSQQSIAKAYADTTNEHVIEDLVDVNWGTDEPAPLLVFDVEEDERLAVGDLVGLIDKGVITVDEDFEGFIRDKYHLPEKTNAPTPTGQGEEPGTQISNPDNILPFPGTTDPTLDPNKVPNTPATVAAALKIGDRELRRERYPHEVKAATDFAMLEEMYQTSTAGLVTQWVAQVKAAQVDDLVSQIEAAGDDVTKLAEVRAAGYGAEVLSAAMLQMATESARQAAVELQFQGATIEPPPAETMQKPIEKRAKALDAVMARAISEAAARKAINTAGGGANVAQIVREHLDSLSDAYLKEQLGGALMQAQNTGRRAVFKNAPPSRFYASELLDTNTCSNCRTRDGREYLSLDEAEDDYPAGGYKNCSGGPKCRGTVVAVLNTETPASVSGA